MAYRGHRSVDDARGASDMLRFAKLGRLIRILGMIRMVRFMRLIKEHQGPVDRGVSNRGVSQSGLLPFLSFLGLARFFRDFPDLSGDCPGIFPICPFPVSRPANSTYEEQSRKGPQHNLDLSRKKWETLWLETPPVYLLSRAGSCNRFQESYSAGPKHGSLNVGA